jgi:nucleoside triphosphate pyrophosphatase
MEDKRNNQASAPEPIDLNRVLGARLSTLDLPAIILASGSPRRAEILNTVNWPFKVVSPDIDETRYANEDAVTYVQRLALAKAEAVAQRVTGSLIVAADTTVVIGEQILEKPSDQNDARCMLRQLSGRWHQVITGVALIDSATTESKVSWETTEVKFATMSSDEIEWYVSSGEPMDKAGAYAIQGLGARFVEGIRGDFFNVMGLPVRLLYRMVQELVPEGARTSLSA